MRIVRDYDEWDRFFRQERHKLIVAAGGLPIHPDRYRRERLLGMLGLQRARKGCAGRHGKCVPGRCKGRHRRYIRGPQLH